MRPHAEDLRRYYDSPSGQRVQARLQQIIAPLLAGRTQDRVLGLGYCGPYVDSLATKIDRVILAHPALQGFEAWPPDKPNCVVQVDDKSLPFADALFDQVIAIHALEYAEPVRRSLREIWRVLAPQGRLLIIVPNRASLVALLDHSPFGNGRPFSAAQIDHLLRDSLFTPLTHKKALVLPGLQGGGALERFFIRVAPQLGGLHIILAQKTDSFTMTGIGRVAQEVPATAPA
jgi:SAM-dependent methyltransferase